MVDKEQIINYGSVSGICEYKLLESELKGHIEDVGFYFKNDSCTDYSALDLLLLTQGYRKFVTCNIKPDELKFQPERSFEISGNIKFSGSKSREKRFNYRDINLTLMCWSEGMYLDQFKPDSLGRFRYQTPLLFGKSHSLLQATTLKGKPFYGEITLNESVYPPQFNPPLLTNFTMLPPAVDYIHQLQTVKKTEISKIPWYGAMSVTLGEVIVTAKAKNWYQDFKKEAKKTVDLDSIDPKGDRFRSVYDLLVEEFDARWYTSGGLRTILLPGLIGVKDIYLPPIIVINGKTFWNGEFFDLSQLDLVNSFSVNEIKKIMVLPPRGSMVHHYASFDMLKKGIYQSMVVIETYSNNAYRGDPPGFKKFILEGLDAPRVFYSPCYDGPSRKSPVYDGRATLYWGSSIRTDSTGQAKVEFFTNDRKSALEVVVNGIEVGSGNPGQYQKIINSIEVKK